MKISFLYVNPFNNTGIPIGLAYLIAILKSRGHELSFFETTFRDFNYSDFNVTGKMDKNGRKIISDFKSFVRKNKPDLIGVNSASLCLGFSLEMLKTIKDRPATIFGGVGANVGYAKLIKEDAVDHICVGFGEDCLPAFVNNFEAGAPLDEVPNLVYKKDGRVIINKFSQDIDLSRLPMPDWGLFDERHFERIFKGEVKRWGNFQLTRGCPFNCAYCVNAYYHKDLKMKIYRFPVEKIIEEIKVLTKRYRLDIVRIFDECFGFGDLGYYKRFAKLYKQATELPTIIETRPESITAESVKILKDMRCISVSIGVESGDEEQRRQMLNRYVSNDIIKKAFGLLRKEKIRTASYNIMGFPGDTRSKIFKTIKLNKECDTDFINTFLFCPFPHTMLREFCVKNSLLETDAIVDYGQTSIIKNDKLSKDDLYGIYRTFKYYVKMPEYLHPLIARAEKDDDTGNHILTLLEEACVLKGGR